jgi:hypothetical protein
MIIVMCIYAIIGVDFFGEFGAVSCYGNDGFSVAGDSDCWVNYRNQSISLVTARGQTYGEEYYGTFFRSLYTLFQVPRPPPLTPRARPPPPPRPCPTSTAAPCPPHARPMPALAPSALAEPSPGAGRPSARLPEPSSASRAGAHR